MYVCICFTIMFCYIYVSERNSNFSALTHNRYTRSISFFDNITNTYVCVKRMLKIKID